MIPARTPATASPQAHVTWADGVIVVRDEQVFGPGGERLCERFLGRVLSLEEVRSVSLDRSQATATIRHDATGQAASRFLAKLSATVRANTPLGSIPSLPRGALRETKVTIHRHRTLLSTCEVIGDQPGRLRIRHEVLRHDHLLAERARFLLSSVPGIRRVTIGAWTENLLIVYDPAALSMPRLVRLVEEALSALVGWDRSLPAPTQTKFGLANLTLGVAAVADFVVPILAPISALLLIGTNFRTFRAAILQVRKRTFGLPVLYSAIVVTTLANGQFFASALMSWLFRFWQGRLRVEIASERRRLLDECLPLPRLARLIARDGDEVLVPVERLRPGDRVVVGPDEPVPADGRVLEGQGIVDERSVRGLEGSSRKREGDILLAGSTVLVGTLQIEVACAVEQTRASSISRSLVAATSPAAGVLSPTLRAEAVADQAVAPTLATAGLGLLVGDLASVAAILRPDYATGPGLAVPFETLRDAALCAQRGIVPRTPDIFDRLARADLIVLEDGPVFSRFALEVQGIQTRLPEADLLRYAASAFRHLCDERAAALVAACRARRIHLLDLPPIAFDPGVTIVHGKWQIRVREQNPSTDGSGPLVVEANGTTIGLIEFTRSSQAEAVAAFQRLRDVARVPLALVSERSEAEVAARASAFEFDSSQANLSPEDIARFLRACRERGLKTVFIGDCRRHAQGAEEAYLSISLATETDLDANPAAVVILQPRLDLVADLWEVARSYIGRVRSSHRFILLPNLLCVAGALFFGATALTSVVVSNLGTLGLYSRSIGSLSAMEPSERGRARHSRLPR